MAKVLRIPSSFGTLSAVIDYPKEKTDKLAILCPGYLDSKYYNGLAGLANTLTKRGYTAVRFEPTGTWESDGVISKYSTTQYLKDVKHVLEYMLGKKRYKHILIGGHSRGGVISILYAARDPRISGVISIMPSIKKLLKNDKRLASWKKMGISISTRDLPFGKRGRKVFCVPISYMADMSRYDSAKDVKRIRVPILIITGENDIINPKEMGREIFENANEPKRFSVIPGVGHDYRHNISEVKIVDNEILRLMQELGM